MSSRLTRIGATILFVGTICLSPWGLAMAQQSADDYARLRAAQYEIAKVEIKGMGRSFGSLSQAEFASKARRIAAALRTVVNLYPSEMGAQDTSRARPTVWSEPEALRTMSTNAIRAAEALETIGTGTVERIRGLKALGNACQTCHERFRE